jgi:hypothetical protein
MELNEHANPHLYDAREQQERIAFLERPLAFDAGRKRPLMLGDALTDGSDDDGVDFVSAALGEILSKIKQVEVALQAGHNTNDNTIHGLDAEAELAKILSAEIAREYIVSEFKEVRATNLAKAWQAVVNKPSVENLQALKCYFGDAMVDLTDSKLEIEYQMGGTKVTMQIDGFVFTTNFERPTDDLKGKITYEKRDQGFKMGSIEDKIGHGHLFDRLTAAEVFRLEHTDERIVRLWAMWSMK